MIRGPKWRVRTSPERRRSAALITFALMFVVGLFIMVLLIGALQWLGAPDWLVMAPWLVPTAGALIWVLRNPRPAVAEHDTDSWVVYSIRGALVGIENARPAPARLVATVLLGAPVAWSLLVFGTLAALGFGN